MSTIAIKPAVNPVIQFTQLLTLFTSYESNLIALSTATSTLAGLTIPVEPTGVAAESDWDTYIAAVNTYNTAFTANTNTVITSNANIAALGTSIINLLPPNCWVKITVSSTIYWIGYHTNDADASYVPRLFIVQQTGEPATHLVDGPTDPY